MFINKVKKNKIGANKIREICRKLKKNLEASCYDGMVVNYVGRLVIRMNVLYLRKHFK